MKIIMMVALTVFFSTCGDADMIKAKQLFDNAKCMECHNVEDFKDKTIRKSKTFSQMKGMVSACQIQHDAQWFDDDEHDVALYLNHEYFHFVEKE
ncbi:MAG: hypothetical protein WCW84_01710 [Sulfurimonas sp.]|jgi:hypothetical protein